MKAEDYILPVLIALAIIGIFLIASFNVVVEERTQESINAESNFWTATFCTRNQGNIIQTDIGKDVCYINERYFTSKINNNTENLVDLSKPKWQMVELRLK